MCCEYQNNGKFEITMNDLQTMKIVQSLSELENIGLFIKSDLCKSNHRLVKYDENGSYL